MQIGDTASKIILGNKLPREFNDRTSIQKATDNLRSVWNNTTANDLGIERLIRLLLALSVFVLPGIYYKTLFHNRRVDLQDLVTDSYVMIKLLYPLVLLKYQFFCNPFLHALQILLIIETMLYIPMLIFASDFLTNPRTYRRSLLLLFVNYAELVCGYAVLYSQPMTMNRPFDHWFDAVYYSAVTAATIGYGEYYPVSIYGKVIVAMQSMAFLVFGVLFLSFFTSRLEHIGYFKTMNTKQEHGDE